MSGIVVFGAIGLVALRRLKALEPSIDLDQFHGHAYKHPKLALVVLLASLGVSGFPTTPTFVGEDLIFTHILEDQIFLASFVALSFIIDGQAIIRIYAQITSPGTPSRSWAPATWCLRRSGTSSATAC